MDHDSQTGPCTAARLTPDERHTRAVESGRRGGRLRAQQLSPERRQEIAQKAATTRWAAKVPSTV